MASSMQSDVVVEPARKKLKTSDLPLTSTTRSAIENLAHTFKKKGGYDALRKQVWEKFEATVSSYVMSTFTLSGTDMLLQL
jgi:hypothetical protein